MNNPTASAPTAWMRRRCPVGGIVKNLECVEGVVEEKKRETAIVLRKRTIELA